VLRTRSTLHEPGNWELAPCAHPKPLVPQGASQPGFWHPMLSASGGVPGPVVFRQRIHGPHAMISTQSVYTAIDRKTYE
jgi:hypothetical protein